MIGGAQIYDLAMPLASELLLTEIDADLDADTFFPPWDRDAFTETSRTRYTSDLGLDFSIASYRRGA